MTQDLTTLIQQRQQLDAQIAAIQAEGRKDNIKKAREFVVKHGLTAAEVFPTGKASAPAKPGKPVPVKYRDGDNTWSGRGIKPKWLSAKLAAGASLADFEVDKL